MFDVENPQVDDIPSVRACLLLYLGHNVVCGFEITDQIRNSCNYAQTHVQMKVRGFSGQVGVKKRTR